MPIEISFAGPILVEHEQHGIIYRLVEIVIEAPGVFPAWLNQGKKFSTNLGFFSGRRFDISEDRNRFRIHCQAASQPKVQEAIYFEMHEGSTRSIYKNKEATKARTAS
jgi:hypothetical protein